MYPPPASAALRASGIRLPGQHQRNNPGKDRAWGKVAGVEGIAVGGWSFCGLSLENWGAMLSALRQALLLQGFPGAQAQSHPRGGLWVYCVAGPLWFGVLQKEGQLSFI